MANRSRNTEKRSDDQAFQPHDRLNDRYEIIESIGVGGMGEVYRAHDRDLDREIAVKTLVQHANLNETARQRFQREVKTLASLSHPNVMRVHDIGTHENILFAVMELVEGEPLRRMIDRGPLHWQRAARIGQGVAEGLAAAHDVDIMHRDIKPENIMIGTDDHTTILDFGLARPHHFARNSSDENLSDENRLSGTCPYMSPEQVNGQPLSCATDLFSLGTVLYEMVTGTNPFRGANLVKTLSLVERAKPPEINSPYTIPQQLRDLIGQMLNADPAARPSATAVADDLGRLQSSQAELASAEEEQVLAKLLEGVSDAVGEEFFRALVKNLAEALGTYCALVTEFDRDNRHARALAFWTTEGWYEGYEYTIAGTPCEAVFDKQDLFHHPDHLQGLFPTDHDLPAMGFVSYMGVPLFDTDGTVLGNLAVLDRKPMPPEPRCVGLLRLFATRAAAEHQRLKRERELREREQRLARLFDGVVDPIIEVDEALTVTQFNRAAETVFGRSTRQVLGKNLADLLDETDEESLRQLFETLEVDGDSNTSVCIPRGWNSPSTDNGNPQVTEANVSRIDTATGHFFTIVMRNVDQTDQPGEDFRSVQGNAQRLHDEIDEIQGTRLIGENENFRQVLCYVAQVASTDATVLINGETGTGKELVARAIHTSSCRSEQPLVCVNCAAIPSGLIESEFFGHEKGAFTGATDRREGRFAHANGGTLFLDEIGELPLEMQGKLLRVLQEGDFEPVGSSKTQHVDVRIIAATNRDLSVEVKEGRFREDLYYRLNVFPIELPALRDRGDDVLLLAESFARDMSRIMGRPFAGLTEDCRSRLMSYSWPGNIRELRNVIERALITAKAGRLDLSAAFTCGVSPHAFRDVLSGDDESARVMTDDEMRELERRNIRQALKICDGKVSGEGGAAELLGLKSSTLSSRIKALGIERP